MNAPGLIRSRQVPQLGTTFSQLQCWYLGIDYRETFKAIAQLGLRQVRLCSYWHEIEPEPNKFQFEAIDWLLEESHRQNLEVVLTVGMKAPRYPEYHFPKWVEERYSTKDRSRYLDADPGLADHTLRFVDRVLEHTRNAPAIKYWQVENEPFAKLEITGDRSLSPQFIRQEVDLVRSRMLPGQKLLLTSAISLPDPKPEDDRAFETCLALADAVGINVYTKVPISPTYYLEPTPAYWRKLRLWRRALIAQGKEAWIAEAQAEPWEQGQLVAMSEAEQPSSSPRQMGNLVTQVNLLGYRPVLLWGCEYWHWHNLNGRSQWWQAVEKIVNKAS
jgi:hypothetical protein